jgi:hypothetical protein
MRQMSFLSCRLILLGVFPPWTEVLTTNGDHTGEPMGYAFLLLPPEPKNKQHGSVRIDFEELVLQWSVVAASAVALIFLTRGHNRTDA